jgi:hypothetical protein
MNDQQLKNSLLKMSIIKPLTTKEILEYECHSHWLAGWISFEWGQVIIANYIARKVARKYRRYMRSVEFRNKILKGRNV